jgi:outer membrane protein assembly factor BamB
VDHFLYASENSGLVQCVDLNTMELIWVQDIKDASNSSPVFQWGEDGSGYLYTSPYLHWTAKGNEGQISMYKLDASSGEILWEYTQKCVRYDDIGGGIQSTPLLGKDGTNIGGLIIYSISRTPSAYSGLLTALDTGTGEKIWEIPSGNYTWSSPAALYTEDGHAYLFLANASGVARLIDGSTGEVLHALDLGQTVEASPAVYNNLVVIGSREGIYCIRVS